MYNIYISSVTVSFHKIFEDSIKVPGWSYIQLENCNSKPTIKGKISAGFY